MKSNNTIEINGKLYDAKTGAPLSSPTAPRRTAPNAVKRRSVGTSIDGFSRRKSTAVNTSNSTTAKVPQKTVASAPKTSATRTNPQAVKRTNRKSVTLNRSGVKSPQKPVAAAPSKNEHAITVTSGALKHADTDRFKRANSVYKSAAISKFITATPKQVEHTAKAPAGPLAKHMAKTHVDTSVEEPAALSTKERLIQHAVASAVSTAPSQSTKKNKSGHKNHFGKYASSALVVIVLAGYVAYLNVPSISMKVAAHRAGFAAAMPSYKPAGYSLRGPIAYSPGQVTVNFKSNTDDRRFSLKQQPTTWDSTALLENYVTKQNPSYLTYQDKGLTIYIYDGSSAAWVNGGKLYNLEGKDSKLDTDQLLKLATSV